MRMRDERYVFIFDSIMIAICDDAYYIRTGIFKKFRSDFFNENSNLRFFIQLHLKMDTK